VRRIDVLFEIERSINGKTPEQRLAVRLEKSRPIVVDLETWMRQQRTLLSSNNDTAKAINYLLNRWAAFTRFLDDGRVCLSNNAAERALRGVAVGSSRASEYEHEHNQSFCFPCSTRHFGRIVVRDQLVWVGAPRVLAAAKSLAGREAERRNWRGIDDGSRVLLATLHIWIVAVRQPAIPCPPTP
jgi:hypothetical protein